MKRKPQKSSFDEPQRCRSLSCGLRASLPPSKEDLKAIRRRNMFMVEQTGLWS